MKANLKKQIIDLFGSLSNRIITYPLQTIIILISLATISIMVVISAKSNRLGFNSKSVWDWMDLLIVPLVLAIGAWLLNRSEKAREQAITHKKQQQLELQAYYDRITNLFFRDMNMTSEMLNKATIVARSNSLVLLISLSP